MTLEEARNTLANCVQLLQAEGYNVKLNIQITPKDGENTKIQPTKGKGVEKPK